MKRIGILGGLGPESTVDYYKEIIGAFNTRYTELAYPEIIIFSANLNQFLCYVEAGNWQGLGEMLLEKIASLHRAGAEFVAIASNTPHVVFDEINARSPVPLLSIVEETCAKAQEMGLHKIGLMGTKFTMEGNFYQKPLVARGMELVVPHAAEQQIIQHRLFSEIELGIIKDSTRAEFLAIVKRMIDQDGIDSLILGCTELPLILTESMYGIPFLNTAAIYCEGIIRHCLDTQAG